MLVPRELAATLRDHEWVIDGSKQFITNSGTDITSVCTVTARSGTRDNGKPGDFGHRRADRNAWASR